MDGMFDRLMAGGQEGTAAQGLKNVRVWQLKPDVDVYMKFIGYEETCRKFGPPDQENYHAVYDGAADVGRLFACQSCIVWPWACCGAANSISWKPVRST